MRLTGIELSPAMLDLARRRAHELGRDVELRLGVAQALDFPASSFDTVVCTLSLCTIPDDRRAVAEARRVLRAGGVLLLLEHVRSPLLPVRLVQQALDPLCVRGAADHLLREPLAHLAAEGFVLDRLAGRKLGLVERVAARKPREARPCWSQGSARPRGRTGAPDQQLVPCAPGGAFPEGGLWAHSAIDTATATGSARLARRWPFRRVVAAHSAARTLWPPPPPPVHTSSRCPGHPPPLLGTGWPKGTAVPGLTTWPPP